jgi:predicted site-specific integrase-resolvase
VRRRSDWLTVEDFCDELGVPISTAYKWCSLGPASGKFPRCCRLPNGKIRIRRDWLEEWLNGLPTP